MDFFGILFDIKNGSKMPYSKNYFDTLFAAKLEELGVKTITGTLPLTFTAKAGNVVDWEIEGNAQGVGERTANIFDVSDTTSEGYLANFYFRVGETNPRENSNWYISPYIPVNSNTTYTLVPDTTSSAAEARLYDGSKTSYTSVRYNGQGAVTFTTGANDEFIRLSLRYDSPYAMLVDGSSAPETYIPYGYQIPIAVSQQGQTDKNYDIYIGDSPLTEGETVSKTSTGVDLELFEGENTVSTTLYNKPVMEIKYK